MPRLSFRAFMDFTFTVLLLASTLPLLALLSCIPRRYRVQR